MDLGAVSTWHSEQSLEAQIAIKASGLRVIIAQLLYVPPALSPHSPTETWSLAPTVLFLCALSKNAHGGGLWILYVWDLLKEPSSVLI